MDIVSYKKIFKYLYENLGFDPLIIHTDYEAALSIAINESEFFTNKNCISDVFFILCKLFVKNVNI